MPVIKSAIKKLRRDRKREKENNVFRNGLDRAVRLAKKQKTTKSVSSAVSLVDRAVKKNLMHKGHAARIKSALSKLTKPTVKIPAKSAPKPKQKSPRKKSAKIS